MKKLKLLATTLTATVILSGCLLNNDAIITINNDKITKAQYEKAFEAAAGNSMFSQMGIDFKKEPDSFMYLILKERVINELTIKTLLDQEVKKRHIKVTNDDVNNEIKSIIDKIGSKEKFNEILKQNGVSNAQLKKDLTDEIKVRKLVDSLSVVAISDTDAKKFYDSNKDKFRYPDTVRASHILISANPEELKATLSASEEGKKLTQDEITKKVDEQMAAQKTKAEKLLAEIKKDKSQFAKIAKENSDDTISAKEGGDLGYFGAEEMVSPFSKAAFSMKPNTISEIVQTPYGYHIIMVTDRKKAGVEPFDKVKSEIKLYLENQEKVKVLQQFVETLKKNAKIVYNDPSFSPEEIQKKVKEHTKNNPALMDSQKSAKE